jgi:hypothetical protein
MKPTSATAPTTGRPNRLLVALAAAWMILSLAIGGAVNADSASRSNPADQTVTSASQP